ncbi:hypothetical protein [Mycolicibacterium sp.]|uniref:hypothetical protein n=1 Tax=Mycolicibacterium sp. TaxID=2320850 RepID=UPI003560029D
MTCQWPIDRTCLPKLPALPDSPSPEEQATYDEAKAQHDTAEGLAVFILWALSGRQFGACPVTVRPCPAAPDRVVSAHTGPSLMGWDRGYWTSFECGCVGRCILSGPSMVHLPGPVSEPTDDFPVIVTIAGEELDPAEFVVEGDVLYRRGGRPWPGQNLTRPLGESGTWSVTYRRGVPVPAEAGRLAGILAREFLAACTGDDKCRLPSNVAAVTRQGVTHRYDTLSAILAAGKVGIREVDLWLAAVNPNRLVAAPEVL